MKLTHTLLLTTLLSLSSNALGLGLQMYSLQEDFDRDTPGTLDRLKSQGFTDIETSVFTKLPAAELRALLDARGMTCSSHHVRPEDLDNKMDQVIADAKALGAVQVVCPILPHKAPLNRVQVLKAAANFNRYGAALKAAGLRFAYHNHAGDFTPTDSPTFPGETFYDVLIAATERGVVSFQLDVFWVAWSGAKATDVIEKHGRRICSLHLKDLARDAKPEVGNPKSARPLMVRLTAGRVDIPAVIAAAKATGVTHFIIEDESPAAASQLPESLKDVKTLIEGKRASSRSGNGTTDGEAWWRRMFSMSFDGHGNFVSPHLGALHTTAASLGAVGYRGVWDADLSRDMPWMRRQEQAFAGQPGTKRVIYIEGCSARKVLTRVSGDGRVLFTADLLEDLSDPQRRRFVDGLTRPDGRTVWISDWQFMQSPDLKTSRGQPLPTAKDIGLPPFTHPLNGSVITNEADFWRTRSASALIGMDHGPTEIYAAIPGDLAEALDFRSITTQRGDGQWLLRSEEDMLYDAPFARYQAAKGRRAMQVLAPDMIHYDDWDLRSPTAMNLRADIHVASFREFVKRRFTEADCRAFGFEKCDVAAFDVLDYLLNPPWRSEYKGTGDQPLWRSAADSRWLSDKVWRAFQIACVEERLASMKQVYRLHKQAARELGREVPMVANVIPMLSALFLQRDCVDMANFEWPVFKTFTAFVRPLGYYPQARLGIGPRMAAKIGVTGHAIVDPYVEPQYSGWDGAGFTRRHYETLHKVIYFDLVANRGIPAFSLTFDGGYSPGSIHSAGNLHAFLNEIAPVISQREYLADIGLASSSWSQIAAQPPWAWNQEVTKRHASEFLGWAQYLSSARDFPQWDVVPFDDVTLDELTRFKLLILPSVLVITAEHLAVLEDYLKHGGKLLVTGETGAFTGPNALLMPRTEDIITPLAKRFPGQLTIVQTKPGLAYHEDPSKSEPLLDAIARSTDHRPVLTASNAPGHVGIYASASKATPAEFTIDLVNYHYDLATDQITPVTSSGFAVTLRVPDLKDTDKLSVESVRYETAGSNVRRQPLDAAHILASKGSVTLRIPPFTHYQVLRITKAKP